MFVLAETPIFIVLCAKHAKFKETQKSKKDTICEHTCPNCSCQSVRFFLHLSFLLFLEFPFFSEMLFDRSPKIKKYESNKKLKTTTTRNNMQIKKRSKIVIQNQTRQQAEKQKQKNILKQKTNKAITKSKNQKLTWETGSKEEIKEKERDKERESEKGGGQKRPKGTKGNTEKWTTKMAFLGDKTGFSIKRKERKAKTKPKINK